MYHRIYSMDVRPKTFSVCKHTYSCAYNDALYNHNSKNNKIFFVLERKKNSVIVTRTTKITIEQTITIALSSDYYYY